MQQNEMMELRWPHPKYREAISDMAKILLALAVIQLLAWLLPTWSDFKGIPYYLPQHILMETASIVVSMMVFAVGWNTHGRNISGNIILLACVFFSVSMLDFSHTVSYGGMPDFFSPNDAQKHLNFWLSARIFAAVVLLIVAIRPWKSMISDATRYLVFGSMLGVTLLINWVVIFHQAWLPDTFIPGHGLTAFKKNVEYLVIVIHIITAAILLVKMREAHSFNVVLLFGAVCTLAMSEFYFTLYTTMTGSYNVLGHIYKVIAYFLIYRAIVVEVIEEPYFQLREAEGQLRSSQQLLDSIIENIPNMIFLKRASDLRFELFNRAGEVLLGYERSKLLGKNDYDFFSREQADSFIGKDRAVLAQQEIVDIPEEIITTAHGVRILHTKKLPINDAQGKPQYLLGISEDITERKLAEATRTQLAAIVESSNDAIIGKTPDGIITSWNKGAEAIYGYTADEIIGKHITTLALPSHHAEINEFLEKIHEGGMVINHESERIRKDGALIHVALTLSPIKDASGNITGISTIARDVTVQKQVEEELRKYKDQLEEKVEQRTADLVLARNAADAANLAKSVFLSSMSHELRTPMNAILGFSNMMRKDPLLPQGQRENLDIINRSGENLLTLINDVLDMAKIEAGRVQLEDASFDLGGMVRDVTDMMHLRAQEKGLQLLIDQSSEFPRYIKGDEARLRQVLVNLVGNAIKFTQQGGVTIRLGTKKNKNSHLLIEVEDSGSGINPADQQKIFEPFVQLGETTTQKGTGLGLTITRQFVQLMGGTIIVESTPGKGSLFRISLPLREVTKTDITKPNVLEKGDVVGLAPGQPEYRILIVEDQLENQLLLVKLMESVGFQVKVAENGEQGVQLFQSWQPHLIWMDRRMPVMDGIEATRRIRELPGGHEVKIVAVTASAFMEQRDEMINAGMDDFVRKPYRFNEIYECLTKQLGVQYTYADAPAVKEVSDVVLTAQILAVLPPDLRRELRDALESLEDERIGTIIDQVASYDAKLHKTLSHLAGDFDYPAILKALQTN